MSLGAYEFEADHVPVLIAMRLRVSAITVFRFEPEIAPIPLVVMLVANSA